MREFFVLFEVERAVVSVGGDVEASVEVIFVVRARDVLDDEVERTVVLDIVTGAEMAGF
ncbi:hypothetical protein [Natrialba taiwanensis]|uniref:hypothetical protein n=1 Tax=Natrialba taiwanensis TaxID=160846 RepID=UPI000AB369EE|nr:hypothetical protein [Natrialba taiwanensis]